MVKGSRWGTWGVEKASQKKRFQKDLPWGQTQGVPVGRRVYLASCNGGPGWGFRACSPSGSLKDAGELLPAGSSIFP